MMPHLPQLTPAVGTQASDVNDGGLPLIATQKGESFDHLMARMVSGSGSKSKNSNSDGQTPAKGQAKSETESQAQGVDAAILASSLTDIPTPATMVLKAPAITTTTTPKADVTGLPGSPVAGFSADGNPTLLANGLAVEKNTENKTPGQKDSSADKGSAGDQGAAPGAINISKLEMTKSSTGAEPAVKPAVSSQAGLTTSTTLKTESDSGQDSDLNATTGTPDQQSLMTSGALQTGMDISGTSIAKNGLAMKKPEQTIKIAEAAGKFLPGNVAALAAKNDLMDQAGTAAANGKDASSSDGGAGAMSSATVVSIPVSTGSRTVERTQEMVVQQAMRLSNSTSDSLQVVIKPGEGTQLSLELRQRGDGVEVQAVLQQGDYNLLKQGWGDLQQQLQQRGIQLGSLTDENNPAGNNGQFQQDENRSSTVLDDAEPVMAMAGGAASVSTGSITSSLTGNGRWQMWA